MQAEPARQVAAAPQTAGRVEESVPAASGSWCGWLLEHGSEVGEYVFSEIDTTFVSHPAHAALVDLVRNELAAGGTWDVHAMLDRIEDGVTRRSLPIFSLRPTN